MHAAVLKCIHYHSLKKITTVLVSTIGTTLCQPFPSIVLVFLLCINAITVIIIIILILIIIVIVIIIVIIIIIIIIILILIIIIIIIIIG